MDADSTVPVGDSLERIIREEIRRAVAEELDRRGFNQPPTFQPYPMPMPIYPQTWPVWPLGVPQVWY